MVQIENAGLLQNSGTLVLANYALTSRPWKTYIPWLQLQALPADDARGVVRGFTCACVGMAASATHEYLYRNLQKVLRNSSAVQ
jgi:hypothetical protein